MSRALTPAPLLADAKGATRLQDQILTIIGSHMRRASGCVWSGGMVELIGELGFSTDAVRAALSRLVLRGLLERHRSGRRVSYALTDLARDLLAEGDRRIFGFGRDRPSADVWTLVWNSLPEDRRVERFRLASRLRFFGFGSLQDAIWIAAANLEEEARTVVRQLNVEPYVSIFPARIASGSEMAILASGPWDFDQLQARYERFIEDFSPFVTKRSQRRLSNSEAFVTRAHLMHTFRGFVLLDPELPGDVAQIPELRLRAINVFDSLYRGLAEPSNRHFEEVALPQVADRRNPSRSS